MARQGYGPEYGPDYGAPRVTADIGAKLAGGTAGFLAIRHAVKTTREGVKNTPSVMKEAYHAFMQEIPARKSRSPDTARAMKGLASSRRAKATAAILRAMRKRGITI